MFDFINEGGTLKTFPTFADIPLAHHQEMRSKHNRYERRKARYLFKVWIAYYGTTCPSCGTEMRFIDESGNKVRTRQDITVDHILAKSLGGSFFSYSNLTCICAECNGFKSTYESNLNRVLRPWIIGSGKRHEERYKDAEQQQPVVVAVEEQSQQTQSTGWLMWLFNKIMLVCLSGR